MGACKNKAKEAVKKLFLQIKTFVTPAKMISIILHDHGSPTKTPFMSLLNPAISLLWVILKSIIRVFHFL